MLKRIKNLFKKKTENTELSVSEKIDNMYDKLFQDVILLHIGEDLSVLSKELCSIIQELREEIKDECGFIIPQLHIKDNTSLQENEFKVYIRGELAGNGFLIPNEDGIREELYDTLKTIIYDKINVIFTNDIAERYLDIAQRKNGWLIWNITKALSVPEIKIILTDLINNGKSICDIGYIFEKIGEEILLDGGYQDCFYKKYNPHAIAKEIAKTL